VLCLSFESIIHSYLVCDAEANARSLKYDQGDWVKHLWTLMLEIVNGYIYVKRIPFIQIHITIQHQYLAYM
jgi:hypothetical protein